MKCYHGTTRENALRILSGECKDSPTWSVSDDEYLYLWCPAALIDGGECEEEEEADERAIRMAFESAQITAAMSEEPQKELVVLCFELPDEIIEADESCENMNLSRRVEDFEGLEKHHIKTLKTRHNCRLDALVISGILGNPNLASWRISDDLREAAEVLRGVWIESLGEFDWEEE